MLQSYVGTYWVLLDDSFSPCPVSFGKNFLHIVLCSRHGRKCVTSKDYMHILSKGLDVNFLPSGVA